MPDDLPDSRRRVPRTDALLADQRLAVAAGSLGRGRVKAVVVDAQERARRGEINPEDVADAAVAMLPKHAASLRSVLNATGVVLHTNLGRASLSAAAVEAATVAAGATDVELDLRTGRRAQRGRATLEALAAAVPDAGAVAVVNNGAAALVLAATALAQRREIVVSRGELVEIGGGFRLPDLLQSTGARLREVGTTNRTVLADYRSALGPDTGLILKVHQSNFVITGFTCAVDVADLASLGSPVLADVGSGLLAPDPLLPNEPDVSSVLRAGAALVIASGDKLLGGPQAGLIFGQADLVERLRRHPLARAVRVDKLTLAALEATVRGPRTPTWLALHADPTVLRRRAERLRDALVTGVDSFPVEVVQSAAVVGGGGAPDLELPSWSLAVPGNLAADLRSGDPAVVGRVERGRLLLDVRCVPAERDGELLAAILAAVGHRREVADSTLDGVVPGSGIDRRG